VQCTPRAVCVESFGAAFAKCFWPLVIDELVDVLASFGIIVKAFADDVKLYIRIINDVGVSTLQEALHVLFS